MDGGVVEGVSGEHLAGLVSEGCTESRAVVVGPGQFAPELILVSYVIDFIHIGDSGIQAVHESGIIRRVIPRRRRQSREIVDYQCAPRLSFERDAYAQDLGRETLPSVVECDYPVTVNPARFDG